MCKQMQIRKWESLRLWPINSRRSAFKSLPCNFLYTAIDSYRMPNYTIIMNREYGMNGRKQF